MRSSFLPNNRMYHHADSESYRHRQIECFRSRCGGRGTLIICKAGDSYLIVECSATFRVLVPPSMCNPRCHRQVAWRKIKRFSRTIASDKTVQNAPTKNRFSSLLGQTGCCIPTVLWIGIHRLFSGYNPGLHPGVNGVTMVAIVRLSTG
jgi:hypothetical protein